MKETLKKEVVEVEGEMEEEEEEDVVEGEMEGNTKRKRSIKRSAGGREEVRGGGSEGVRVYWVQVCSVIGSALLLAVRKQVSNSQRHRQRRVSDFPGKYDV